MRASVCDLCQSRKHNILYRSVVGYRVNRKFDLVRCQSCGLVATSPKLSAREVKEYYNSQEVAISGAGGDVYIQEYKKNRAKVWEDLGYQKRLEEIKVASPKARSLLDVGCGAGIFLDYARSRGMDVYGLEISDWGYQTAMKELKLKVYKSILSEFNFREIPRVDVITMYDVLEHTASPRKELKAAYELLNSGGLLIVNLPNINSFISRLNGKYWNKLIPPNHTFHFNPSTLASLVKLEKFKVIQVGTNNGDPKELAAELVGALWLTLAKIWPSWERAYAQRLEPFAENRDLKLLIVKVSRRFAMQLSFLARLLGHVLIRFNLGEGVHLVAKKHER